MKTVDKVRAQFPNAIALADEVRNVFGNGVKLLYLREGAQEYGNKNPEKGTWVVPSIELKKKQKNAE